MKANRQIIDKQEERRELETQHENPLPDRKYIHQYRRPS